MRNRLARTTAALAAVSVAGVAALPGMANGDAVYHTQHMQLTPVGDAPLRSGFVQNIKANGPTIYAHEVYVLSGAGRRASYTVTNHFFFEDTTCSDPANDFPTDTAELRTNRSGNGKAQVFFVPADVEGLQGVHGVIWTIQNSNGEVVYQTGCSRVTLD